MASRPRRFYGYGYEVRIRFVRTLVEDDEACYGTFDGKALVIEISERYPEQLQRVALFHEIAHFAYRFGGHSLEDAKEFPGEEPFTTLQERTFWPLLSDPRNRTTWNWIIQGGANVDAAGSNRVKKRNRHQRR